VADWGLLLAASEFDELNREGGGGVPGGAQGYAAMGRRPDRPDIFGYDMGLSPHVFPR
jgi:hypothetical protein